MNPIAESLTKAIGSAAFLLLLWACVYPHPYVVCITLCALWPWIALLVMVLTRANMDYVAAAYSFVSIALAYRAFHDFALPSWSRATLFAFAASVILWFATFCVAPSLRRNWGWLIVLIPVFAVSYGYGVVLEMNARLDSAPGKHFTTSIVARQRIRLRRFANYTVTLGPWGNFSSVNQQSVDSDVYYSLVGQSQACVHEGPGRLGIEWYEITRCR